MVGYTFEQGEPTGVYITEGYNLYPPHTYTHTPKHTQYPLAACHSSEWAGPHNPFTYP